MAAKKKNVVERLNSWQGLLTLLGLVIAILAFFGGGTFLYNELFKRPDLTFTSLPNYDLGGESFSGLVIENRGQIPLSNVEIVISNLETQIVKFNIPGAHEQYSINQGGEGTNGISIHLKRFSVGASLPIYIVTYDSIQLSFNDTLFIASDETSARSSAEETPLQSFTAIFTVAAAGTIFLTMILRQLLKGSLSFGWIEE